MTTPVHIDEIRCRGYGICASILPDVFDLPPGAKTPRVLNDHINPDDHDDLDEAIRSCPAQAIQQRGGPST